MGSKSSAQALQAEANRLYWRSDLSVNRIAEELNLSKSALYGLLQPLEADAGCPQCGTRMVFDNRTARDRGLARCPSCDAGAESAGAAPAAGSDNGSRVVDRDDEFLPAPGGTADEPALPSVGRTLAAGALLGAAVGLAVVLWTERRR